MACYRVTFTFTFLFIIADRINNNILRRLVDTVKLKTNYLDVAVLDVVNSFKSRIYGFEITAKQRY
jgi:hypothetical protein